MNKQNSHDDKCAQQESTRNETIPERHFALTTQEANYFVRPASCNGDIFIDIERLIIGDAELNGCWSAMLQQPEHKVSFRFDWISEKSQEQALAARWIHFIFEHWQNSPNMHVYHATRYELYTLKTLSDGQPLVSEKLSIMLGRQLFVDVSKFARRTAEQTINPSSTTGADVHEPRIAQGQLVRISDASATQEYREFEQNKKQQLQNLRSEVRCAPGPSHNFSS